MDRVRRAVRDHSPAGDDYQPIVSDEDGDLDASIHSLKPEMPFSWIDYGMFLLLGVSMLWAWNMFIAAAPYFLYRFESSPWIDDNFQSSIVVTSTLVSMIAMIVLTNAQKNASYPRRVVLALVLNLSANILLTISAVSFETAVNGYFGFVLVMVAAGAIATSLQQNGLFSLVSGYGREEYLQAIMAGQGIAGIAPCIVQIVAILSVPQRDAQKGRTGDPAKSAFAFFLTAVGVSVLSILAFAFLMRRQRHQQILKASEQDLLDDDHHRAKRQPVPLLVLFWKLKYFATAIFLSYGVTMVFPVFAEKIYSVVPEDQAPRLLQRASFIPLALFLWNLGDVVGKTSTLIPALRLTNAPKAAVAAALARFLFVPLFFLCNIKGRGALLQSDFFYLFVVQFLFGLTAGWLGSACIMAAPHWVDDGEKEAAGSFMGLALVSGLTIGGLLTFLVS